MAIDFFDQLRRHAAERPAEPILQTIREHERESITYGEMMRMLRFVSAGVSRSGVTPGERVGILMENDHHWVLALLGTVGAGAIAVPLDPAQSAGKLAATIEHAECRLLLASDAFATTLRSIQQTLPELFIILRSTGLLQGWEGLPGIQLWHDWLNQDPAGVEKQWPSSAIDPDADFLLVYTGGTTGTPKGVRLSLRALLVCIQDTTKVFPLSPSDHILSILPLFHIMAIQASVLGPLYKGARITYLISRDAKRIIRAFREEAITAFLCVPLFYYQMRRCIFEQVAQQPPLKQFLFHRLAGVSRWLRRSLHVNAGKLLLRPIHAEFGSAFRGFGVGGARFAPEVATELHDLGFRFFQGYGMTETAALSALTPMSPDGGLSCGRALERAEVSIHKPDQDGIGEVKVRGPHLMSGYWRDEQASANILRDGCLWTGDLGYLDARQRLHITGRKKDVIVLSSGKNIFPEPLEQHYQSACPLIAELCIVGLTGTHQASERLHAVIVPDFDAVAKAGVINVREAILYQLQSAAKRLPPYEHLLGFEIRKDPLPRTSARKLQRFKIAEELQTDQPSRPVPESVQEQDVDSTAAGEVLEIIRRMKSTQVQRSMNLELDLGFDSLERVELLANIQNQFGISLPEDQYAHISTVQQLISAVEDSDASSPAPADNWQSWAELLNEPLTPEESILVDRYLSPRPLFAPVLFILCRLFCFLAKLLFRFRFEAQQGWPGSYPFIIAANHQSYLDTPLLMGSVPYRVFRRIFFLSTSRLHRTAFQLWFGRSARAIPIDPDRRLRTALRLTAEGLRRGMVLCAFPEGHRSMDEQLQPFRKGMAILAVEEKIGVVPIGITGTGRVWGRTSSSIRLATITIVAAPLLQPGTGMSHDEFTAKLFDAISSLLKR